MQDFINKFHGVESILRSQQLPASLRNSSTSVEPGAWSFSIVFTRDSQPLVPILSHMNLIHTLLIKILYAVSSFPYMLPAPPISFLDVIALIKFGEEYIWSSS